MDTQLEVIFLLTFVIHLIGTLSYAARIAGTKTGRVAVSLALFNVLMLVSRLSNSFQGPLLAKRVECRLLTDRMSNAVSDFRWLLVAPILATVIGAVLIPTFQRLFSRAIERFSVERSVPKLILHSFSKAGIAYLRDSVRVPARANITQVCGAADVPIPLLCANAAATSIWTVGVFAALYAGCINPSLRVTASTLSSIVNGAATILMFVLIDPYLSVLTDDVMQEKCTDARFRRAVIWLTCSRLVGVILAQALLVPAAILIASAAKWL
jgi:hypothetical protein